MKRIFSTLLAIALLLGLGALAVLARGGDILTPADNAVAAAAQPQTAAAPDAPAALLNYNLIALPLDVQTTWANITPTAIPFTAHGLAQYVGLSSVDQVLHWDPVAQRYDQWIPVAGMENGGYGYVNGDIVTSPWSLTTGQVYRLLLNNTNQSLTLVSFVGDVPPANSIKFILHGTAGCQYNQVSVPLERGETLTTSRALADSMGGMANVSQVLRWDPAAQRYDQWIPVDGMEFGGYGYVNGDIVTSPWSVNIGYPYVVCLLAGADTVSWPY